MRKRKCWAPGCVHYEELESCRFFRFPKFGKERLKWKNLLRVDVEHGTRPFVCSCHFRDRRRKNGLLHTTATYCRKSEASSSKISILGPTTDILENDSSESNNNLENGIKEDLQRNTQCLIQCPLCEENEEAKYFEKLNQHLKDKHGQETENKTLYFLNFEECSKWMKLENIKNNFVVSSTIKEYEYTTTTYECNHNNSKNCQSMCVKGGSVEIKEYCPSQVIVKTFINGEVIVQFCKTHVGHLFDITSNIILKEEENEEEDEYTKYKSEVKTWNNNIEQLLMQINPEMGYRIMQEANNIVKKIESEVEKNRIFIVQYEADD